MEAPLKGAAEVRLIDVVRAIRNQPLLVVSLTVVVFAILATIAIFDEPVYRAYVTLAPEPPLVDRGQLSLSDQLLNPGATFDVTAYQPQTSPNQAFGLLRSRAMTRQFIESEELLPTLFAEDWDAQKQGWRDDDPDRHPTIGDAVRLFEREVRFISKDASTGLIRVNIEWNDPVLAAHWANGLVEIADREIRRRDIQEATERIKFLEAKAKEESLDSVRKLIYGLVESNTQTIMLANVKDNYAFTIIDPAIAPQIDDSINMPAAFRFSIALVVALSCGVFCAAVRPVFASGH